MADRHRRQPQSSIRRHADARMQAAKRRVSSQPCGRKGQCPCGRDHTRAPVAQWS